MKKLQKGWSIPAIIALVLVVGAATAAVTALACVDVIYTDLAVVDVTPHGLGVREIVEGLAFDELVRMTGVPLSDRRASA